MQILHIFSFGVLNFYIHTLFKIIPPNCIQVHVKGTGGEEEEEGGTLINNNNIKFSIFLKSRCVTTYNLERCVSPSFRAGSE